MFSHQISLTYDEENKERQERGSEIKERREEGRHDGGDKDTRVRIGKYKGRKEGGKYEKVDNEGERSKGQKNRKEGKR